MSGSPTPGQQPPAATPTVAARRGAARGYLTAVNSLLAICLRDQLTLGVLWRDLARRAQRHNRSTPLGDALDRVCAGITEDIETFEMIMRELGIRTNPVKTGLAMVAERCGRLKLMAGWGRSRP